MSPQPKLVSFLRLTLSHLLQEGFETINPPPAPPKCLSTLFVATSGLGVSVTALLTELAHLCPLHPLPGSPATSVMSLVLQVRMPRPIAGPSHCWPKVAHLVSHQAWAGTKALLSTTLPPAPSHASLPPNLIYGSPLYTAELVSGYIWVALSG